MNGSATTVGDVVTLGARRFPDRVAVKRRGHDGLTYAQLDDRTTRLANALLGIGLEPGDRVAAWMADTEEYVELYVAAAKAGLVVAPINARLAAPEASYQLRDSGGRAIVFSADMSDGVAELDGEALEGVQRIGIAVTDVAVDHDWERLVADGSTVPPTPPVPDDLFILGYTSGTTGRPKGAMLTHRSVLAIGRLNAMSFRLSAHAVVALTGSMSFVSVVPAHVLMTLYLGGTIVIMGRWSPDDLVSVIEAERATFTYIPSPLLPDATALLAARRPAWKTLHSVLHSASRAAPEKLEALHEVIGDRLVEGWGMTENSGGLAAVTTVADYAGARPGDAIFRSVGRAAVETGLRLVDEQGAILPADGSAIGELCFSSPALMTGYWNQPEATAEALRGGWYHSGDLGMLDPFGYVQILERRTDLIVSGGANVYPSEVERCIGELVEVQDVAVVGVPHDRWGQTVLAVVVRSAVGHDLTEEAVVAHCRRQLAGFKKPNRVVFADELPRTAGLKVARAQLRDQVVAQLAAELR